MHHYYQLSHKYRQHVCGTDDCARPSCCLQPVHSLLLHCYSNNNPHMLWIINLFFLCHAPWIFLLTLLSIWFQWQGTKGDLLELEAYVYRGDLLGKSTLISHQSELSCHHSRASCDEFKCLTGQHVTVGVSVMQRVKVLLQDILCNLQIKQIVLVVFLNLHSIFSL